MFDGTSRGLQFPIGHVRLSANFLSVLFCFGPIAAASSTHSTQSNWLLGRILGAARHSNWRSLLDEGSVSAAGEFSAADLADLLSQASCHVGRAVSGRGLVVPFAGRSLATRDSAAEMIRSIDQG